MENILQKELATFDTHRHELLEDSRGKYVLIKGEKILGIFDTQMDAVNVGYDKLGNVPFLVKEITDFDAPQYVTSGLIEA